MTRMKLEIREATIFCGLIKDGKYIAMLAADQIHKGEWSVTSDTHPDSEALNDFEASDQWIAAPLIIGIARRLNQRILAGEEE